MIKYIFIVFILGFGAFVNGQQTVGLLSYNEELSSPGYNMFFSHNQSTVYLIDACGEVVHSWEDDEDFRPGNSVYLLPNSNLVKCKRDKNSIMGAPIWAGGGGETVEILSWDNKLISSITLNDSLYRFHHDVAPMPNGNVLMIAWNAKSKEEAIAAGRLSDTVVGDKVWSLAILEWNPTADEIIWEWKAWDHLIQDINPDNDNFGNISDYPEKININYYLNGFPDWLHTNAIDYNPVLDQIVVSIPHFDEFWIIDHSTTSEEVATSSGGNAGMGGDLLYRWGNPKTYNQGDSTDQKLFFQHDVHWVNPQAEEDEVDFGKIILFNNRRPGDISAVNILQTPIEGFEYSLSDGGTFLPSDFEQTIIHPEGIQMAFSGSVSSAQVLPNKNILTFAGRWGYAYELTPENRIVWEYRVPLNVGLPVSQGDIIAIGDNLTFRMERYALEYPAFDGKDLSPKGYIELNPDSTFCEEQSVGAFDVLAHNDELLIFPNPTEGIFTIKTQNSGVVSYSIIDVAGQERQIGVLATGENQIDISDLSSGVYFLHVGESDFQKIIKY